MAAGGSRRRFLCVLEPESLQVLSSAVQCSGDLVRPLDAFEARSRGWRSNFVACLSPMAYVLLETSGSNSDFFLQLAVSNTLGNSPNSPIAAYNSCYAARAHQTTLHIIAPQVRKLSQAESAQ